MLRDYLANWRMNPGHSYWRKIHPQLKISDRMTYVLSKFTQPFLVGPDPTRPDNNRGFTCSPRVSKGKHGPRKQSASTPCYANIRSATNLLLRCSSPKRRYCAGSTFTLNASG